MFDVSEVVAYSVIAIAHLGVTTLVITRLVRIVARQRTLERILRERWARAQAGENRG